LVTFWVMQKVTIRDSWYDAVTVKGKLSMSTSVSATRLEDRRARERRIVEKKLKPIHLSAAARTTRARVMPSGQIYPFNTVPY
jgi:hypothetical protein